jgi:hypothetical protein
MDTQQYKAKERALSDYSSSPLLERFISALSFRFSVTSSPTEGSPKACSCSAARALALLTPPLTPLPLFPSISLAKVTTFAPEGLAAAGGAATAAAATAAAAAAAAAAGSSSALGPGSRGTKAAGGKNPPDATTPALLDLAIEKFGLFICGSNSEADLCSSALLGGAGAGAGAEAGAGVLGGEASDVSLVALAAARSEVRLPGVAAAGTAAAAGAGAGAGGAVSSTL